MMGSGEPVEAVGDVSVAGRTVEVRFRIDASEVVAGAPVEIMTEIRLGDGDPFELRSAGARSTARSREYSFEADGPDSVPLRDPFADEVDIGGVESSVLVASDRPDRGRILLNRFLTLEDLRSSLPEGGRFDLVVHCERRIRVAGDARDAEPPAVRTELRVPVVRDDAACAAEYGRLADVVLGHPSAHVLREQALDALLSARSTVAEAALVAVAEHPDPTVAGPARHAIDAMRRG
ncbi:hypothetical protein [Agromyces sp. ZXT2-6]|uniref:hypothetical protein n=1 Tax=Agromyces sp. ZXT2-6 TaxID=3461153 RepID=UPI004054E0A2